MPKFFYTENNHRQYRPPDNFWRKFLKYRKKKQAETALQTSSKLNNPYQSKRKDAPLPNRRRFNLAILVILLLGWMALIIYLPFFQIKTVLYNGLDTIKLDEIQDVVNSYLNSRHWLPTNNFFIARSKTLTKKINLAFSIETVNIQKIFPDTIEVNITEKISSVVYDSGTNYFLIDEKGLVIKQLNIPKINDPMVVISSSSTTSTPAETDKISSSTLTHLPNFKEIKKTYGHYPIVYNQLGGNEEVGQTILKPEIILLILNISKEFEQRGIGEIQYFTVGNPSAGLTAKINKTPFEIFLSIYGDLENQINNIRIILQSHQPTEYIDVRYGERVFWK
ncbi:MAG: hypothetical protein A2538_01325 [Candidatus Magasanikbacteria bacterium RIFOXYD2_FULL_41_14]|uniref:POTRA domain-containing protein n=1 Tax=Candidatus Magasanikbacteria bacterium RIFOXYD2_FULL_41_14 TaxID=1798709 RepID=A0A1F6PGD3_9BACT|nr:MAG: hypothetical protein A2538_01325 [Candidatus Magasanikbacteria bacterium RIFOXYD2_FULL_41_14]